MVRSDVNRTRPPPSLPPPTSSARANASGSKVIGRRKDQGGRQRQDTACLVENYNHACKTYTHTHTALPGACQANRALFRPCRKLRRQGARVLREAFPVDRVYGARTQFSYRGEREAPGKPPGRGLRSLVFRANPAAPSPLTSPRLVFEQERQPLPGSTEPRCCRPWTDASPASQQAVSFDRSLRAPPLHPTNLHRLNSTTQKAATDPPLPPLPPSNMLDPRTSHTQRARANLFDKLNSKSSSMFLRVL